MAIKILEKAKIAEQACGVEQLLNEVKVHWALGDCDGVLNLL